MYLVNVALDTLVFYVLGKCRVHTIIIVDAAEGASMADFVGGYRDVRNISSFAISSNSVKECNAWPREA